MVQGVELTVALCHGLVQGVELTVALAHRLRQTRYLTVALAHAMFKRIYIVECRRKFVQAFKQFIKLRLNNLVFKCILIICEPMQQTVCS